MSCPTCDHTMHRMSETHHERIFWCPRCGSLRRLLTSTGNLADDVPMLVPRVRKLLNELSSTDTEIARLLGIEESVTAPPREDAGEDAT